LKVKVEKNWAELTPEEKREERFKLWLSPPGVKFASPEAEKAYKARVTRLINAIQLKEPDRVPVSVPVGSYPAYYAGTTLHEVMYDYGKLRRAWLKFLRESDWDTYNSPGVILPGKALQMLDPKATVWPGHGLSTEATTVYQYVEGEYMMADEYDYLIRDPSDFWIRTYMPRIARVFEPYRKFPSHTNTVGLAAGLMGYLMPYTMPDVQTMFQKLIDAGKEISKWMEIVRDFDRVALESGFPSFLGAIAFAPFDMIGDFLRGTRGIMLDMYRNPYKLLEAIEGVADLKIKATISDANASGALIAGFPLHKGDDTFMSQKQYETFYWPSLKKVINAFINEGLIVFLYAEGIYEMRLETIKDVPRGTVVWQFDKTDMARAKKVLGDTACISGNVPSSLLHTGTPQAVKEYCRRLIEDCGKGGGYILTGEAPERGNPDNLRAMMEAAKEYGVYK
jgi:uroporphyrinogen-III decarboxylase